MASVAPIVRLLRRVEQRGDCWVWAGGANRGYGVFKTGIGREQVYVHRWSYEYHRAEIPDGLFIDHLCKNTLCVNPWHMEPVTTRVNNLRSTNIAAVNSSKTRCIHGHEFTPENTIQVKGGRKCRTCQRKSDRLSKARARKAQKAEAA